MAYADNIRFISLLFQKKNIYIYHLLSMNTT